MKIPGWCSVCRKVKRVTVRIPTTPAIGICDDCRDDKARV